MSQGKNIHETEWIEILTSFKISSVACKGNYCDVSLEKEENKSNILQSVKDKLTDYKTVSNSLCIPDPENEHEKIKQGILIPLTVLIIGCNFSVLSFLIVNKRFHSPTYFFIGCLGIADSFVGFVSIGTLISHATESTLDKCLIRIGFTIASCMASLLFLMCISIDRYIAITQSLLYKQIITPTRVGIVTFFVWLFSLCFGFLPLMGWRRDSYPQYCSFLYVLPDHYIILLFTVGAFCPFLIMFSIYIKLYRSTKVHIKRIEALENIHSINRRESGPLGMSTRTWKSVKTLVVVVGCVFLTWIPFILTTIVQIICGENVCHLKDIIGTHLLVLGFSNSFLNPLIYAFRSKDFREKVKNKFCRRQVCQTTVEFISVYPVSQTVTV